MCMESLVFVSSNVLSDSFMDSKNLMKFKDTVSLQSIKYQFLKYTRNYTFTNKTNMYEKEACDVYMIAHAFYFTFSLRQKRGQKLCTHVFFVCNKSSL